MSKVHLINNPTNKESVAQWILTPARPELSAVFRTFTKTWLARRRKITQQRCIQYVVRPYTALRLSQFELHLLRLPLRTPPITQPAGRINSAVYPDQQTDPPKTVDKEVQAGQSHRPHRHRYRAGRLLSHDCLHLPRFSLTQDRSLHQWYTFTINK